MSAVAEIRFSDVASYVGLALLPNHASRSSRTLPPKARPQKKVPLVLPGVGASSPSKPSRGSDGLPPIVAAQADKVKSRLHLLEVEQQVQREQVKKLETCLSDSLLLEKKAKERASKHRELHSHHKKRALRVEREIERLRSELNHLQSPTHPSSGPLAEPTDIMLRPVVRRDGSTGSDHASREDAMEDQPQDEFLISSNRSPKTRKSRGSTAGSSPSSAQTAAPVLEPFAEAAEALIERPPDHIDDIAREQAAQEGDAALQEGVDETHRSSVVDKTPDIETSSHEGAALPDAAIASALPRPSAEEGEEGEGDEDSDKAVNYLMSLGKHESRLTAEERAKLADLRREVIRKDMVARAGGAREAFRAIDLNGSGSISSQEFSDGVSRLGVPWRALTGMSKPREFFKLFDDDRDHVIIFKELFPDFYALERSGQVRASTPDFCKRYHRQKDHQGRPPAYQPCGPDEELQRLFENAALNEQAAGRRQWMQQTMRRLQSRGKSAARCRELVALHLPRGTGPRDRQGVNTISEVDVRKIRQTYSDDWNGLSREAGSTLAELKDLRGEQRQIFNKLYKVTEAEFARAKAQEQAASGLGLGGGLSLFGKAPSGGAESAAAAQQNVLSASGPIIVLAGKGSPKTLEELGKEIGMQESQLDDMSLDFEKVVGRGNNLTNKVFTKLLKVVAPARTCNESDVNAWWTQIAQEVAGQKGISFEDNEKMPKEDPRKAQCNFEQFARWYASSEIRTKYVSND